MNPLHNISNDEIPEDVRSDMDEYGFVIHQDSVALTSGSVRTVYSVSIVPVIRTSQSRQHGKSESDSYYLSD
ncbi:hypothetical protein Tco_0169206 [Tanacetum coccineum]